MSLYSGWFCREPSCTKETNGILSLGNRIWTCCAFQSLMVFGCGTPVQFSSVTQSYLTLRLHESQHTRPPCPSPTILQFKNIMALQLPCIILMPFNNIKSISEPLSLISLIIWFQRWVVHFRSQNSPCRKFSHPNTLFGDIIFVFRINWYSLIGLLIIIFSTWICVCVFSVS